MSASPLLYPVFTTNRQFQIVFIIDLPRLETGSSFEPTLFSQELFRFLDALGLDENLVRSLENYDFTATKQYGFVHTMYEHAILQGTRSHKLTHQFLSIPSCGSHVKDDWKYTGIARLRP